MPKVKVNSQSGTPKKRLIPATTPEAREKQLASLAMDLIEQRLLDGTASSQETTYFLKAMSTNARLQQKLLETEIELKAAKTKQIEAEERQDELFAQAIEAMRRYKGENTVEEYDDDED